MRCVGKVLSLISKVASVSSSPMLPKLLPIWGGDPHVLSTPHPCLPTTPLPYTRVPHRPSLQHPCLPRPLYSLVMVFLFSCAIVQEKLRPKVLLKSFNPLKSFYRIFSMNFLSIDFWIFLPEFETIICLPSQNFHTNSLITTINLCPNKSPVRTSMNHFGILRGPFSSRTITKFLISLISDFSAAY